MTNKEAIAFFEGLIPGNEISAEATRLAIEALKEKDNLWRFFKFREPTDEEKESYENVDLFVENCPECGEEVLVWNGKGVYQDTFFDDGDVAYFENSIRDIQPGWAWMPLPKPPKDGEQE